MKGINFVVDDKRAKTAVIIDLKNYSDIWEDFYDSLAAHERASEPRQSIHDVKEHLHNQGKLEADV
ncbi:MAG: hypothetical protein SVY53_05890 [Chloroflexota bacterium]|nr:hypothetical protein [Chloroflexota bacterium]